MSDQNSAEPLYSVGFWDMDRNAYRPHRATWLNMPLSELRELMRHLRRTMTEAPWRRRRTGGPPYDHDSDPNILVERTDGLHFVKIFKQWER